MGPPRAKLVKRVVSPPRRGREEDNDAQGGERVQLQSAAERRSKSHQDFRALKGKAIARSPTRKRKPVSPPSDSSTPTNSVSAGEDESEEDDDGNRYVL